MTIFILKDNYPLNRVEWKWICCLQNITFVLFQASVTPELGYTYKKPYFSTDEKTIRLLQPATSYTPTFSELTIEKIEQPIKCNTEITVTIKYHFVGETASNINTQVICMVSS